LNVYIEYIMTSLNAISTNTTPSYTPVASQRNAAVLSAQAVDLSGQSAVVATLGGATSGTGVYSAAGLLNSLAQAGVSEETISVPEAGSNTDTSQSAQQALDQGILASFTGSASSSGIYTVGGSSSGGLSDQVSSNWAEILKTNSSYASTVIGSSFASGIIGTLNVTA
jgi:hypothetical protein